MSVSSFHQVSEDLETSAVLPASTLKVSSSTMADTKIHELSNRLSNLEKIIDLMLKLPDSKFYCTILEKKISQFEEMISHYPESANDIAENQRVKVISMWFRYCTKLASSSNETSPANSDDEKVTASVKSESIYAEEDSPKSDSKNLISSEKDDTTSENNKMGSCESLVPVAASSLDDIQPKKSFDLEKCKLRYSLEQSFAQLNAIESDANVEDIKKLICQLAYTKTELTRYQNDSRLHFAIFKVAFDKLSLVLREQFLTVYGSHDGGINITNLISLLEAEIAAQHSKKVNLNNMPNFKPKKTLEPNFLSSVSVPFRRSFSSTFCKYCKSTDHVRDQCPNIKKLLCFKCYQTGHTKPWCSNQSK